MTIFRILTIAILSLILAQTLSFEFLGKASLMDEVLSNYETYSLEDNDRDTTYCWANISLSDEEQSQINKLRHTKALRMVTDTVISDNIQNPEVWVYALIIEYEYSVMAVVHESEATGDEESVFTATWDSKYLWLLFKWIKLKKVNTGVS